MEQRFKEELQELFLESYSYFSSEEFEEHIIAIKNYSEFIEIEIVPNYGKDRTYCPNELKEIYEPKKEAFMGSINQIKIWFQQKNINRDKFLTLIKYCKRNSKCEDEGMIDLIQCVYNTTLDYTYRYHAHHSNELQKALLLSRTSFLKCYKRLHEKETKPC